MLIVRSGQVEFFFVPKYLSLLNHDHHSNLGTNPFNSFEGPSYYDVRKALSAVDGMTSRRTSILLLEVCEMTRTSLM